MTETALFAAVLIVFLLAGAAPFLVRALGRNAGYPLAAGFLLSAGLIASGAGRVVEGRPPEWSVGWVPGLGVELSFVLDGLSLLFSLVILLIGAAVLAYSARYFKEGSDLAGTYGLIVLFAGSMLGLVLAGDLIVLFVFWEMTSITSFFLIGGSSGEGGKAATRALLVTGGGGLALLAGLVLLSVVAGTSSMSEVIASEAVGGHGLEVAIIVLLLLGAFTKSAQVPFHFWLPGAMVAPTPVSTYLHAATMVKAGIYLLARFSPLFSGHPVWLYTVVVVGLVTSVVGAFLALKQFDLKALLAYSTVSQLGFIVALVGTGTAIGLTAASVHIVAHALYKATLFMVVGIIDREAGSRDLRELGGLRKAMPLTATATGLAALSMAGIPPALGFISKEEAFSAFVEVPGGGWLALFAGSLAVLASIFTFAYGARILDGAFGGPLVQDLFEPKRSFLAPALITSVAGLGFGLGVPLLAPYTEASGLATLPTGEEGYHIALWHGFTPALAMSGVTILLGSLMFSYRSRVDRVLHSFAFAHAGERGFDRLYDSAVALGKATGDPFVAPAPARYLGWVLTATTGLVALAWFGSDISGGEPAAAHPPDWFVVGLLAMVCFGVARASNRLAAAALIGLIGFLVAIFYVLLGAPDLAITQLLVETLTVALVVLVFRLLPRKFVPTSRKRRFSAGAAALAMGAGATFLTYTLVGRRPLSEAGEYFLDAAETEAEGHNVVNTILVDFRALDTLGEVAVLAVAAIGVYILARFSWRRTH